LPSQAFKWTPWSLAVLTGESLEDLCRFDFLYQGEIGGKAQLPYEALRLSH